MDSKVYDIRQELVSQEKKKFRVKGREAERQGARDVIIETMEESIWVKRKSSREELYCKMRGKRMRGEIGLVESKRDKKSKWQIVRWEWRIGEDNCRLQSEQ